MRTGFVLPEGGKALAGKLERGIESKGVLVLLRSTCKVTGFFQIRGEG